MTLPELLHMWGVQAGTPIVVERFEPVPVTSIDRLTLALDALRRALPPAFVTVPEAAKFLGIAPRTAWRRVRDGSWPVRRDGRRVLVDLVGLRGPSEEETRAAVLRLKGGHGG